MDKKVKNYQIFSIFFTFILGILLHFTYKLSGENLIVASFSAVNESVWEHLKLLFFPMLLTTIIGYFYLNKEVKSFLCSKTIGIVCSIVFIVVFFYTYTGILGKDLAFIDITSFFVATIFGEYISYKLMLRNFKCNKLLSIIVLIALTFCFILFTYLTPRIGIFKDPIKSRYGITKN